MIIVYGLAAWFVFLGIFALGSYSEKCSAEQRTLEEEARKWRKAYDYFNELSLQEQEKLLLFAPDLFTCLEDKYTKLSDRKSVKK